MNVNSMPPLPRVILGRANVSRAGRVALWPLIAAALCLLTPNACLGQSASDGGALLASGSSPLTPGTGSPAAMNRLPGEGREATGQSVETIRVTAQGMVPLSQRYRRLERIFRRFNSFPEADRAGLTLHLQAMLQPGDGAARTTGMMMKLGERVSHLFPGPPLGTDDEIVVPHEAALWEADPAIYARLKPGERLNVGFFFTLAPADRQHFTRQQALKWLAQLDGCIEDEGGFLVALLLPDTHRLGVDVAPGSRFIVREGGVERLLVDNQGSTPYPYVFRPQNFRKDAEFSATRPLSRVVMTLPFALRGDLTAK
ncbi:hypothetical protein [Asaia sp. As-1742]|uniref:hypothetical protein n=1 Tax=Asaia sp. As-1742 TaxID=2608325 RepID=UPI001422C818|nr:hypothetical protein [Asaia sp. As-1742]NIE81248.1 hypothetical protein [Asaia sp. As-1742]